MADGRRPPSEPALESALDAFVEWAQRQELSPDLGALPPEPVLQRLAPGVVLGDFELVRTLGTGSMGVVFEARQVSVPGRSVAVKAMRALTSSARAGRRFRREIAVIGQLDHPGVVPVLAAGVESGVPYYAMKYVHGTSAAQLVQAVTADPGLREPARLTAYLRAFEPESSDGSSPSADAQGPVAAPRTWEHWVAELGARAADALQHAHERGVVHRDVKPGNVLIDTRGRPILCDFGLAWQADDATLTESGDFLGTLAYASPEQLRGEPAGAQSDVYSLGATLYELLALRRPHDAATRMELLRQIDRDELAPLPARVPAPLRTIVRCALAAAPRQRYASGKALAEDLRAFLAGRSLRARSPGFLPRLWRAGRRHPRVALLVFVAALVLGSLAARDHLRARRAVRAGRALVASAGQRLEELGALAAAAERGWPRDRPYDQRLEVERAVARSKAVAALDHLRREAEGELALAFEHVAGYGPARSALADLHAIGLSQGLLCYRDVFEPAGLREVAAALALDRPDDRALDPTGWLAVESEPSGARADLVTGRQRLELGQTPLRADGLPEGEGLLELTVPGRPPVRSSVLVRRTAADRDAPHPSRTARLRLPPEDAGPPGFIWIPDGWCFVEDDPPRRVHVAGFWIQEREVTFGDWLEWINALAREDSSDGRAVRDLGREDYKPRFSQERSTWQVEWREEEERFVLRPGVDPRWPVRGITLTEMVRYAETSFFVAGRATPGLLPGLPARAEWVRAARGAGARRWPWGDEFDYARCSNYFSGGQLDHEVFPDPVLSHPGDVSWSGVRDLAGSVREATRTPAGQLRGTFLACGGSYRDTRPEALSLLARTAIQNQPYHDVGFRLVLRPLPDWARLPGPAVLVDDFERPDAQELGQGWVELEGPPYAPDFNPVTGERVSLRNGRLVVRGGHGNFSQSSWAWHAIAPDPEGFRLRVRLEVGFGRPDVDRGATILLVPGLGQAMARGVRLGIGGNGGITLSACSASATTRVEAGRCVDVELAVRPSGVEARVLIEGAERSGPALLRVEPEALLAPARFLAIVSPHAEGGRCEVEEIALLPLTP